MSKVYRTVSVVELYNGKTFTSEPSDSKYDFSNGISVSDMDQVRDEFTDIDFGGGRVLTIRPSDIIHIENITTKIECEEVSEEEDEGSDF